MRIMITGGSGMIGRHLASGLLSEGHQAVILSRHADAVRRDPEMWPYQVIPGDPATTGHWQAEVDGCDAVINLAGHNIFAGRWNPEIKRKIRDSRVYGDAEPGRRHQASQQRVPRCSFTARRSATTARAVTKSSTSRAPRVPIFWRSFAANAEEASEPVESFGVRRAIVRTGIVLAPGEGRSRDHDAAFQSSDPGCPSAAATASWAAALSG